MEWDIHLSLSRGGRIPVGRVPFLIGRSPECDFRLNGKSVGRRHCEIATTLVPQDADDELEEDEEPGNSSVLCIIQTDKNVSTSLDRRLILPASPAILFLNTEHVLIIGEHELRLLVAEGDSSPSRGRFRLRKKPGGKAKNRGGQKCRSEDDEFDETLRARR